MTFGKSGVVTGVPLSQQDTGLSWPKETVPEVGRYFLQRKASHVEMAVLFTQRKHKILA